MSRIRGKNTSPEMAVRRLLHRMGYRFRLHVRIPITEDLNRRSRRSQRTKGILHSSKNPPIHSSRNPSPRSVPHSALRVPRSGNSTPPAPHSALRVPRSFVCPDIVLPKYKTVIFVHGCFWHRHRGCKNCTTPPNRREWWLAKLEDYAKTGKLPQPDCAKRPLLYVAAPPRCAASTSAIGPRRYAATLIPRLERFPNFRTTDSRICA